MALGVTKRTRRTALLEGMLAGVLFGTAAIFIRLSGALDAYSISLWRLVIASVALAPVIIARRNSINSGAIRRGLSRAPVLGVFLGLHFILFVSAVVDTTIINATVLVNTTPIWSMFVSAFIFRLKPSRLAVFGIAVSFLGVCIITFADASAGVWSLNLKGNLEAVLAAVVEAFYLNYGRESRRKMPVLPLMLVIYLFSGATVLAVGVAASAPFTFPKELPLILALIGLGVLPTAMAHSLYFSSLYNFKSFETATMALLEPVIATVLGIIIFAQIPGEIFALGACLVLAGIVFVTARG